VCEAQARRANAAKTVKRGRGSGDRLVGFTYDETTGVAHFSMYVPGTAGRVRKRATVRAATYEQAVGLWSVFRSRAAEGLRRPSPEAPTFCEFITDYFPSIEANVKEKTASDYRYGINRHLIPQLGALRLTEITSGVLNRMGASLKAAGYAGATVNKYMSLATLLLGYAVEFDVIAELPLKKKLKKQKANKPCLELNAAERAAFLAAFDDEAGFRRFLEETMPRGKPRRTTDGRFGSRRAHGAGMRDDSEAAHAYFLRFQSSRGLFLAALETGIRSADLRALVRANIYLEEGWIRFTQQKTGKEVIIPISDECRLALSRAFASRTLTADDPVFVTETGLPYGQSTMRRYFKIAKRIAGITRRVRFHDLRHTFGCDLATAGLPLRFIGKVMGHTNATTTERYARPDQIVLERVREALNRAR
jgi:integrase